MRRDSAGPSRIALLADPDEGDRRGLALLLDLLLELFDAFLFELQGWIVGFHGPAHDELRRDRGNGQPVEGLCDGAVAVLTVAQPHTCFVPGFRHSFHLGLDLHCGYMFIM